MTATKFLAELITNGEPCRDGNGWQVGHRDGMGFTSVSDDGIAQLKEHARLEDFYSEALNELRRAYPMCSHKKLVENDDEFEWFINTYADDVYYPLFVYGGWHEPGVLYCCAIAAKGLRDGSLVCLQ